MYKAPRAVPNRTVEEEGRGRREEEEKNISIA